MRLRTATTAVPTRVLVAAALVALLAAGTRLCIGWGRGSGLLPGIGGLPESSNQHPAGSPRFVRSIDGIARPLGVAAGPDGRVYVTEGGGERRIRAFDVNGTEDASFTPPDSASRSCYRDRTLKSSGEAYNANDFALCFLCHSAAPFTDRSGDQRTDTSFRFHGYHIFNIGGGGGSSTDIDTAGAGQGKAICAECHYRVHSTKLAPWTANRTYTGGVNFAPNVQPISGQAAPLWSRSGSGGNCTLRCHGEAHSPENY